MVLVSAKVSNSNEYREYSSGKGRPVRKADNFAAIFEMTF
jgi:hypothetical protein